MSNGIGIEMGCYDTLVEGNYLYHCWQGIQVYTNTTATNHQYRSMIRSNQIDYNSTNDGSYGISLRGYYPSAVGNTINGYKNTTSGYGIGIGCYAGTSPTYVSENTISNCVYPADTTSSTSAVTFTENTIYSCSNAPWFGATPSARCIFTDGNNGFVTDKSGSSGNTTSTTAVLNHGLAGTPLNVVVSGNDTALTYAVTTLTSTQITVTATGTPSGSFIIYWKAEYL